MKKLLFCLGLFAAPAFAQSSLTVDDFLDGATANEVATVADTDGAKHIVCVAVSGLRTGFQQLHQQRQGQRLGQRHRGHGLTKIMAAKRALRKCKANAFAPATCRITHCRQSLLGSLRGNINLDAQD